MIMANSNKNWITKYPELQSERINKDIKIDSIKFILENNYFMFNTESYHQVTETAMDTKAAPTYAN